MRIVSRTGRKRGCGMRRIVFVFFVCVVFLFANTDSVTADGFDVDLPPEVGMLFFFDAVVDVMGIVFAGGNLYYALEEERSTPGWRIGGWVAAGLNAAGGIVYLSLMIENGRAGDLYPYLCAAHFAIAGLDIGFTIWASSQPERKSQKLTMVPMVMPDARGQPAFGVGLRLLEW